MTNFSDLGLSPRLLEAVAGEGYVTPTPIQAKAIPPVLAGSDLLGIAQTGTGKTAAFALPILQRLSENPRPAPRKGCRVLVLSPTRELATQIGESFRTYGRRLGLTITVVFGGVGHRPQSLALQRGVDVLVATPGRLLDHMAERNVSLSSTEIFVLDEADQMLDLGFVKPIRRIVGELSAKRQNLFFSATMPSEIGTLAAELLRNPVRVAVTPVASTVDSVEQKVIHVESHKKRALLVELLADADMARALIFTRTKRGADRVANHLEAAGISVSAIHGNKSQRQREMALAQFKSAKIRVLVATDIAARGIDVEQVTHVVNYELPDVPEAYVHRIGRTARAGASGIAISLCDGAERGMLRDIERLTRQTITGVDRRNDDKLVADRSAGRSGEDRRRDDRRGRDRDEGRRHGGRSGDGARGDAGGRRHAGAERPRFPRNGNGPAVAGDRRDSRGHHEQRPSNGAADRRRDDGPQPRAANGHRPSGDDAPAGGHRHRGGFRQRDGASESGQEGRGARHHADGPARAAHGAGRRQGDSTRREGDRDRGDFRARGGERHGPSRDRNGADRNAQSRGDRPGASGAARQLAANRDGEPRRDQRSQKLASDRGADRSNRGGKPETGHRPGAGGPSRNGRAGGRDERRRDQNGGGSAGFPKRKPADGHRGGRHAGRG